MKVRFRILSHDGDYDHYLVSGNAATEWMVKAGASLDEFFKKAIKGDEAND